MKTNNVFGPDYDSWAEYSAYITFIPITFHWSIKLNLSDEWTIPTTDWKLGHIILSNNTDFNDQRSVTVISVCITDVEAVSKHLDKRPGQCSEQELIDEVFRQLKIKLNEPNLPTPGHSILSPKVYKKDGKWSTDDSAFIFTVKGFKNYKSNILDNLYSVGTHNGNSEYIFTSMEAAVGNALSFVNDIIPQTKHLYKYDSIVTLNKMVGLLCVIMIIMVLYYKLK